MMMSPQAWCPLGGVVYPASGNTFSEIDQKRIGEELARQSNRYGVSESAVMLAWLLKRPASILPIIGSTTPKRIRLATSALDLAYTTEDWYRLLEARNGRPVP